MAAWGFAYKTTIIWKKPRMGLGRYFRNQTEQVLFSVKGDPTTRAENISTIFEAPLGEHSEKPERLYEIIREASYPPFGEAFQRQPRPTSPTCSASAAKSAIRRPRRLPATIEEKASDARPNQSQSPLRGRLRRLHRSGARLSRRRLRRDLRAPGRLRRDGRPHSFRPSRGRGADNDLVGTWIIPSGAIKAAKIKKGRAASTDDRALLEGEPGKLELSLKLPHGSDLEFRAIDGTFPDWRRVIPLETRQEVLAPLFNPDHLKRLWKAGEILGEKCSGMGYNGDSPALLKYQPATRLA